MRIEVIGYLQPGADETHAVVLVDGREIGAVRIALDDIPEGPDTVPATVLVVDPGRGWHGQLPEWEANRDEWAAAASPAGAELIRSYHASGANTSYVTAPDQDEREVA